VTYRGHTATLPVRVFDPGPWSGGPTRTHSVAYQVDHGHSGHVTLGGVQPALPLQGRWTVDLGGEVFYPLVADRRVFVITRGPALFTGAHLRALDVATGDLLWGPISIPGTINIAYHAYHAGKVFVTGADGVVLAFDAATGAKLWETDLQDSYDIEAPPVAIDGLVYVLAFQGSSTLFAIDQEQGHVLWRSFLPLGIRGSPAVDAQGVYLTNQGRVHKLDRLTGELIWSTLGQYGLDTTPVTAGSRLWIRYTSSIVVTGVAPNAVMNPEDGSVLGTFPGVGMPAVAAGYSYHVVEGRLVSLQVATQQQRWEFAGDGQLLAPALVIDDHIVVASRAGRVYMLAAATGTEVWSDDTPPPIEVWDEHRSSMGVGSGYLLVPGGTTLTGWKLVPQT
jgi:outer membrane protein assembly factor BamB